MTNAEIINDIRAAIQHVHERGAAKLEAFPRGFFEQDAYLIELDLADAIRAAEYGDEFGIGDPVKVAKRFAKAVC